MFTKILSMFGMGNQGQRQAARAAREQFSANYPGEPIAWIEIADDEPALFRVCVHHGRRQPKDCRYYRVDKETLKTEEENA